MKKDTWEIDLPHPEFMKRIAAMSSGAYMPPPTLIKYSKNERIAIAASYGGQFQSFLNRPKPPTVREIYGAKANAPRYYKQN
jgi:hypothetical protein